MSKKEQNIISRRLMHSYLSSIVSIGLVLFLAGLFALIAANAASVSRYFKENFKITAVMRDDLADEQAQEFAKRLKSLSSVRTADYVSKEEGTEQMKELLGEDFLKVFESNPVPVSIDITLNADYFSTDSLPAFRDSLLATGKVQDVVYENSVIDLLNSNLEKIGMVFVLFIGLLLFISFILINNTVRLNLYSKRFSISTMRLVGATRAFIRAPFLIKALFQGFIAGLLASILILGLLYFVKDEFQQIMMIMDMRLLILLLGGVVLLGIVICLFCTFFVVNRILSLNIKELYI